MSLWLLCIVVAASWTQGWTQSAAASRQALVVRCPVDNRAEFSASDCRYGGEAPIPARRELEGLEGVLITSQEQLESCDDGFVCLNLRVKLDWSDPLPGWVEQQLCISVLHDFGLTLDYSSGQDSPTQCVLANRDTLDLEVILSLPLVASGSFLLVEHWGSTALIHHLDLQCANGACWMALAYEVARLQGQMSDSTTELLTVDARLQYEALSGGHGSENNDSEMVAWVEFPVVNQEKWPRRRASLVLPDCSSTTCAESGAPSLFCSRSLAARLPALFPPSETRLDDDSLSKLLSAVSARHYVPSVASERISEALRAVQLQSMRACTELGDWELCLDYVHGLHRAYFRQTWVSLRAPL